MVARQGLPKISSFKFSIGGEKKTLPSTVSAHQALMRGGTQKWGLCLLLFHSHLLGCGAHWPHTGQSLTCSQICVVALGPPGLVLQPLKGIKRILEVELDHAAPAYKRSTFSVLLGTMSLLHHSVHTANAQGMLW